MKVFGGFRAFNFVWTSGTNELKKLKAIGRKSGGVYMAYFWSSGKKSKAKRELSKKAFSAEDRLL